MPNVISHRGFMAAMLFLAVLGVAAATAIAWPAAPARTAPVPRYRTGEMDGVGVFYREAGAVPVVVLLHEGRIDVMALMVRDFSGQQAVLTRNPRAAQAWPGVWQGRRRECDMGRTDTYDREAALSRSEPGFGGDGDMVRLAAAGLMATGVVHDLGNLMQVIASAVRLVERTLDPAGGRVGAAVPAGGPVVRGPGDDPQPSGAGCRPPDAGLGGAGPS